MSLSNWPASAGHYVYAMSGPMGRTRSFLAMAHGRPTSQCNGPKARVARLRPLTATLGFDRTVDRQWIQNEGRYPQEVCKRREGSVAFG